MQELEHQVQQFFDEWSMRFTDSSLGKAWAPEKVVATALNLFALNGVPLSADDVAGMARMQEDVMISELVARMPEHISSNFTNISLQLQMLVASATRVRKAAENGDAEALGKLCDAAESGSMRNAILMRATMDAASECGRLRRTQDSWVRSSEDRLVRLAKATETAERARAQLAAVEGQLEAFHSSMKSKCMKFLMWFASDLSPGIALQCCFKGWHASHVTRRSEKHIRDKFEQEIGNAEQALIAYKKKRMENVRGVLGSGHAASISALMGMVVAAWREGIAEFKAEEEAQKAILALEGRLMRSTKGQVENAKKVLTRICGQTDAGVKSMAMAAWISGVAELKQDREVEKSLVEVEAKLKAMMERNKSNASGVLNRMNGACDSGIVELFFSEWRQSYKEAKREREAAESIHASLEKFKHLKLRQSTLAKAAGGKVNEMINALLLMKVLGVWTQESRVTQVDRYYSGKISSKRKQLQGVQSIFMTFARQLESGLANIEKDDDDPKSLRGPAPKTTDRSKHGDVTKQGSIKIIERSSRHNDASSPARRKGMSKDSNAVSLPNIHGRQAC
mmetsp:Transcript_79471/g.208698  ORF Transcript_79471/g.208698 Transcript_79471/m.208698 type:complete len:567 (-) Transcript_79471:107-1807(-)